MNRYPDRLSDDEAAAALVDIGRALGLSDEVQRAHLASLGLSNCQVEGAMGGTEGYYLSQTGQTVEEGGQQ